MGNWSIPLDQYVTLDSIKYITLYRPFQACEFLGMLLHKIEHEPSEPSEFREEKECTFL